MIQQIEKSAEWQAEYYKTIGGSKSAAAVGLSRYNSRSELGRIMLGQQEPPDLSDNLDVVAGTLLEHPAMTLIAKVEGYEIEPHDQADFQYNDEYPHAHSLPDGWVGSQIAEIKNVRRATLKKLARDGIAAFADWYCQAIHNLAVCDAETMLFFAVNWEDKRIVTTEISRNIEIESSLMASEAAFMAEVDRGIVPADVAGSDIIETVEQKLIIDAPIALAHARAYLQAKQAKDEADSLLDEMKDELLGYMGDAASAEFAGVLKASHSKVNGRRSFDHKTAVSEDPDLERYYRIGKPYMRFAARAVKN